MFSQLSRIIVPLVIGLSALVLVFVGQLENGGFSVDQWIWAAVWVIFTLFVSGLALYRIDLGRVAGISFVCLVGFAAALWPTAFIVAQDPIDVDALSLRTLLPSILLVFLCWLALYLTPPQNDDRALQRLYWRFSSPSGRLLMMSLLLTILFFVVVARTLEPSSDEGGAAAEFLVPLLQLFVGSNLLYFVIVAVSIWGFLLALNLTACAFGTDLRDKDEVIYEGFSAAVTSDRRVLGVLVAVLPLLGFLGTVIGISDSMAGLEISLDGSTYEAGDIQGLLRESLGGLSLAFETTILGIGSSAVLLIMTSFIDKGLSSPSLQFETEKASE
ncbi:MAG: MotA/TolQ/ExbB proton channel family protein [Pseudomonadota bacterium]